MNGLKKIGLLIPSLQAGGMERVMSTLIWYFSKKTQVDLHLILYGKTREIFYDLPLNVHIHTPPFTFHDRYRFLNTIRTMLYLRKTYKEIKPDVSLSFGEYWNNLVLLSLLGIKSRIFVSDRSQPDKSLGKMHEFLRKKLYPHANGVIVQTKKAKEIYTTKYQHSNMVVIGNPININVDVNPEVNKKNQVLMVGRLINSKNQDRLIRIFLACNKFDWKLVLVGYDHLKQKNEDQLINLIYQQNAQNRIILAGKQSDVTTFYLESRIFAFTSSSEGFPNVIGEAMAAGLPVIAYNCVAGPSEMINNGVNGYLIDLYDDESFGTHLKMLMDDKIKREEMGSQAQKTISSFRADVICEEFWETITSTSKLSTNKS